jgi:CRP-like cAMP-binding protein
MRDTAAIRRWFAGLALLDQLHAADRDLFAEHAEWVGVGGGERVHGTGEPGTALWFLVEGQIILGAGTGAAADGVVRRAVTTPGYPVGWDGMVWPRPTGAAAARAG